MTFLSPMDGQPAAAVAACRSTRSWTASEDSRRPVTVGNSGPAGSPGCWRSQVRITAATFAVSGVTLLPGAEDSDVDGVRGADVVGC